VISEVARLLRADLPVRSTRAAWVAIVIAVVAVAADASDDARGDRSAREVFEAQRATLIEGGVRTADGFVFSTVTMTIPPDASDLALEIARESAGLHAAKGFLAEKIAAASDGVTVHASLKPALAQAVQECADASISLVGVETVFEGREAGRMVVVKALPAENLAKSALKALDVRGCLRARCDAPQASAADAMLLLELTPADAEDLEQIEKTVLNLMSREFGPGIRCAADGSWPTSDLQTLNAATELWRPYLAQAFQDGTSIHDALSSPDPAKLESLDLKSLLGLVGHRVHDSGVIAAASSQLRKAGWVRSASLIARAPAPLAKIRGNTGKVIPPELRAKMVSHGIVTIALLSGGDIPLPLATADEPAGTADVRQALAKGGVESLSACIERLLTDLSTAPHAESLVLLGAALVAADETALAMPICVAAYRAAPSHAQAGANLLQALAACGARAEAAAALRRIREQSGDRLDDSAKAQIAQVAAWLEAPDGYPSDR
jgi:hypothetical protein